MKFKLESTYKPKGSQPEAIQQLNKGLDKKFNYQTLLGVTGSGKTLTVSDAKYFTDGFGIIPGDRIQLENTSTTATIETINYDNNTITLTQAISWEKGQKVSLPYRGTRPDIGAYESNFIISSPQNLRIIR